jgi:hypothetical protein
MLGILGIVLSLVWLVLLIIVAIKQFQNGGVVHGIIGIFTCGIWTFIWGWVNSGKLNIRNLMLIWTLVIIVCLVLNFKSGALTFTGH